MSTCGLFAVAHQLDYNLETLQTPVCARRLTLSTPDREAPTPIRGHARYLAVSPSPPSRIRREGRGSAESQARDQGGTRKGCAGGVSLSGACASLRQDLGDVSGIDWEFVVLTRATVQVEDARSTMAVFMHVREQYELDLLQGKECVAGLPG